MEPEQHRRNPNVCESCERLLEDESPMLIPQMPSAESASDDKLLDEPQSQPHALPKRDDIRSPDSKTSQN